MSLSRVRIINETRGIDLASRAEVAESFLDRLRGLIGRRDWSRGDGLVIRPCNSVHCLFMSMIIDVCYVDPDDVIIRTVPELRPWRLGPLSLRTRYVVELPQGTLARTGTDLNDVIRIEASADTEFA